MDAASMNIETASNLYVVPLSFIEDSIDTRLGAATRSTSSARTDIEATGSALLERTNRQSVAYSSIARLVAVARLVATASRQEAARALGRARAAAEAARGAARTAESASEYYALLAQIEQLEDACARVSAAADTADLIAFEVPALTSLAALCASLYPGEGLARMSELLAANRERLANPAVIRPGMQLLIPRPSPRR